MKEQSFINTIKNSLIGLFKNPILFLPSIMFLVLLFLMTFISTTLTPKLTTNTLNFIWIGVYLLVLVLILAFFSSGLIGMSKDSKPRIKNFFLFGYKFLIRAFIIFLLFFALIFIINILSFAIAYLLGMLFKFNINAFKATIIISFFLIFVGSFIFLVYSNFILVLKNTTVIQSIRKSISLAKRTYSYIILMGLALFVLDFIASLLLNNFAASIYGLFYIIIIVPLLFLILTKIVQNDIPSK